MVINNMNFSFTCDRCSKDFEVGYQLTSIKDNQTQNNLRIVCEDCGSLPYIQPHILCQIDPRDLEDK